MEIVEGGPRFCVACNWIGTNGSRDSASYRCFAPQNLESTRLDLVTGNTIKEWKFATCVAARGGPLACGEEAKWFKEKPEEPPLRHESDRTVARAPKSRFSADEL